MAFSPELYSLPLTGIKAPWNIFDMALSTTLNFKNSIWYYNTDGNGTFHFQVQRSKQSTIIWSNLKVFLSKCSKVVINSFMK